MIKSIAIVTSCKKRLLMLKQSLPAMLGQELGEAAFWVYVVDYGCPERTYDWLIESGFRGVKGVKVLDVSEVFNMSHARNIGARCAIENGADALAFVDADIILPTFWLDLVRFVLSKGFHFSVPLVGGAESTVHWPKTGTSACLASSFLELKGYDEEHIRYGLDDSDFYNRMASRFGPPYCYDPNVIEHLYHGDDIRVEFRQEKDFDFSSRENASKFMSPFREVNPSGWGQCQFEYFQGRP